MNRAHRWLSIFEGCLLAAISLHILQSAGLLISGTAGLTLIVTHTTGWPLGYLFFLLNLPFYLLAFLALGLPFTLRTFASITLLSALTELLRATVVINIHPAVAAPLGGMLLGFGLILIFRHQASLGGFNILAVYLERTRGWHASLTTLSGDLVILALGVVVMDPVAVGYSLLAFLALTTVVGRYHRPPAWATPKPVGA